MQAEVIDLLSGKRDNSPTEQALVLAEAIDMAVEKTQFVTVSDPGWRALPLLMCDWRRRFAAIDGTDLPPIDVRFAKIDARFR